MCFTVQISCFIPVSAYRLLKPSVCCFCAECFHVFYSRVWSCIGILHTEDTKLLCQFSIGFVQLNVKAAVKKYWPSYVTHCLLIPLPLSSFQKYHLGFNRLKNGPSCSGFQIVLHQSLRTNAFRWVHCDVFYCTYKQFYSYLWDIVLEPPETSSVCVSMCFWELDLIGWHPKDWQQI